MERPGIAVVSTGTGTALYRSFKKRTGTLSVLNRSNTGPFDRYLTGIFRASSIPFHSCSFTVPVVSDRYRSVRRTGPFRSVPVHCTEKQKPPQVSSDNWCSTNEWIVSMSELFIFETNLVSSFRHHAWKIALSIQTSVMAICLCPPTLKRDACSLCLTSTSLYGIKNLWCNHQQYSPLGKNFSTFVSKKCKLTPDFELHSIKNFSANPNILYYLSFTDLFNSLKNF